LIYYTGVLQQILSVITTAILTLGHGLVLDELTNGQAVMYHSSHRLTASMTYVYELTNDQWARLLFIGQFVKN